MFFNKTGLSDGYRMFSAATYQFTKSVGKHTLHPVPSIDEGDNIKPLQLVIKSTKRKFIFFEKAVYNTSEFHITDVLTDPSPIQAKVVTDPDLLTEFNRTTKLSLKGKFGVDIKKEILDVELETTDSISLDIKFGKIAKTEVKEPELLEELNQRHVNMDHPYIRQIREDRTKVLCVITGVDSLPNGGTIHRITALEASLDAKSSLLPGSSDSDQVAFNKDRDIGLAPNTPVAYALRELNVDKNTGAIQLVLTSDKNGGFKDCIGYDEVDASSVDTDAVDAGYENRRKLSMDIQHPREVFKAILDLPANQRQTLTHQLLTLLYTPRDVSVLADIIERTENKQQNKMLVSDVEEKIISPKDTWLGLLQSGGFVVNKDELVQPSVCPPLLKCLGECLDAASEIDDDVLELLRECSKSTAPALIHTLQEGMKGKNVTSSNDIQTLNKDSNSVKLLLDLKFGMGQTEITAPVDLVPCIDEVYWVVFALWGEP